MRTMTTKLYIIAFISVLLNSCNNSCDKKMFLLPNGETYECPKFNDFAKKPLKFSAYSGIYVNDTIGHLNYWLVLHTEETTNMTNSSNIYNDDSNTSSDVIDKFSDKYVYQFWMISHKKLKKNEWDNILMEAYSANHGLEIYLDEKPIKNGVLTTNYVNSQDNSILIIGEYNSDSLPIRIKILGR